MMKECILLEHKSYISCLKNCEKSLDNLYLLRVYLHTDRNYYICLSIHLKYIVCIYFNFGNLNLKFLHVYYDFM